MKDKHVVITGAGGSIGSQLCERALSMGAKSLSMLSLTESGLYNIERRLKALGSDTKLIPILGSVCDRKLVEDVVGTADVVVHAAAHKHLPLCELNPIAAIENNVRGTLTLAKAAYEAEVEQFVLISTDKAVRPASVMGATKRVAEMIVGGMYSKRTRFVTVRFGNVLDSAGSVLPLWREQIAKGGPLTLTDARCERYFMSIPQACDLILGVLGMKDRGTYVFDMGEPVKLVDLARNLIEASGRPCDIKFIGLRPGEKLTEELHVGGRLIPTEHDKIFLVEEAKSQDWRRSLLPELLTASTCRRADIAVQILREIVSDVRAAA